MYYRDPTHTDEIQIALPPGSYFPQIYLSEQRLHEIETVAAEPHPEHPELSGIHPGVISQAPSLTLGQFARRGFVLSALIVLVAVAIGAMGGLLIEQHRSPSPIITKEDWSGLSPFWQPILDASPPDPVILICVGQMTQPVGGQQVISIGNAFAVADITHLLSIKGARYRIDIANSVTLKQMQSSTVILIGGVDNPWTLFEANNLRFYVRAQNEPNPTGTVWIEDRRNPGKKDWFFSTPSPNSGEVTAYAILARYKDASSGQWRVVVSGLNDVSMSIASGALTDPGSMRGITRRLPAGWTSKNLEMVFEVKIVSGKPSYPQMVAYEIW
jgi:hypothetical protein